MKVTINLVDLLKAVLVGLLAFIFVSFWGLEPINAFGCSVSLALFLLLNNYLIERRIDDLVNYTTRLIKTVPTPQVESLKQSRQLDSNLVAWNDTQSDKFLHPYQKDIDRVNREVPMGRASRYPLFGQTLAITFDDIVKQNMTVGRFVANNDGTLYPHFAETSLEIKEFASIFGSTLGGKVENYYYNLTTGQEFILLTFPDKASDPKAQYLLLRLPKDANALPFKYERTH